MTPAFFTTFMTLFGLLFGSFANVVIWRMPRGESVASPGSHCPGCDSPIAWYDNIPVVSWIVLRARCRSCGVRIPLRYPLVELASGALFAAAALTFGPGARAVLAAAFFWFLLVLSVIDLDHLRLPNALVGVLASIGAACAIASEVTGVPLSPLLVSADSGVLAHPLAASALGAVLGAGLSGGIAFTYGVLRGKRGLGMGDVKLLGALGIFLGPYVLLALFFASILGAVVGLIAARGGRLSEARIPFGPWLAAGGMLAAVIGPAVMSWYLRVSGIG